VVHALQPYPRVLEFSAFNYCAGGLFGFC
jgi:hypothetical protein